MDSIFEGREEQRYPFFKPMGITWTDANGDAHQVTGTTINVSNYGALVELPEPIPLFTQVRIQIEGKEISSKGNTRYCQKAPSSWFQVGIRFERTLLAEHIRSLDEVLIHSLRCANVTPAAAPAPEVARSRSWRQLPQSVAQFLNMSSATAKPNELVQVSGS
jgi:hypothetical protein